MKAPILFYQTTEGNINVEVTFLDENFWLTQKAIAQLFNIESNTVTYHLKEIFKSNELIENSVTRKIRATATDGKN
jgi:hypothetical protein